MRESLSFGGGPQSGNIETADLPATIEVTPLVDDYAVAPTEQSFDWPAILQAANIAGELPAENQSYLVVFRSVRRPDADAGLLDTLDNLAHREAAASDGFLHYFKGDLDEQGNCLSFCLWRSMEDGKIASSGSYHREAAIRAGEFYFSAEVEMRFAWLDDSDEGFAMSEPRTLKMEFN